jgi:hypothetical protein
MRADRLRTIGIVPYVPDHGLCEPVDASNTREVDRDDPDNDARAPYNARSRAANVALQVAAQSPRAADGVSVADTVAPGPVVGPASSRSPRLLASGI